MIYCQLWQHSQVAIFVKRLRNQAMAFDWAKLLAFFLNRQAVFDETNSLRSRSGARTRAGRHKALPRNYRS